MNLHILAADIVRRVQHSPDGAHNLAETVAGLIQAERDRALATEREARLEAMREHDRRRGRVPTSFLS